ncbi:MAG: GNAT family N-acetyltransferase [Lachnospiraceae bacterium]|nr:GNAT family N-acetyltransferase [Lachnospiraceae bacterium]
MIQAADNNNLHIAAEMAAELWDASKQELLEQFKDILNNKKGVLYLKYVGNIPVGFAQCQLRNDYVEGTDSSPVGYLEGIFVREEYRKNGYAKELLNACQQWSKNQGCIEFASDCEQDNADSLEFHMKTGFTEANRIICFTKLL